MLPMKLLRVVEATADNLGWPGAHLAAVVDVESNGQIFAKVGGKNEPVIAFEPHVFYRRLPEEKRAEALKLKLASKAWNKRLYKKTQVDRWVQLEAANAIDHDAALEATSWGVGQVLGENWKSLGYDSIEVFVAHVRSGLEGQIAAMVRFINLNGLDDELIAGQWTAFARGYNGKEFKKNAYHTKLADAARLYGGDVGKKDGMLRMGSKGAKVRELQTLLLRAGYQLTVDGDFGPATKRALIAFQKLRKITADGVYGPETARELGAYRQSVDEKVGEQAITAIPEVQQGGGGILGSIVVEGLQNKVDDATAHLEGVSGFEPWLGYGLAALSVIALGLAAWGAYRAISGYLKSRQTVEA